MKTILRTVPILAFMAVVIAGCSGNGCAVGKGQLNPATGMYDTNAIADVAVVTAESTRATALGIFDALMKVEREHEAALKAINPGIHEFAEKLRRESKGWLNELTEAKKQYQITRSAADASRLKNALTLVDQMLASAGKHLAEAANRKAP